MKLSCNIEKLFLKSSIFRMCFMYFDNILPSTDYSVYDYCFKYMIRENIGA